MVSPHPIRPLKIARQVGVALLVAWSLGAVNAGEVFKWTDKDGNVQFGDRPPTDKPAEEVAVPKGPTAVSRPQGSSVIKAKQYLDDRKRESDDKKVTADAAKKEKQELATYCDQLKGQLNIFENGGRIYKNVGGEQSFYSSEEIDTKRDKLRIQFKEKC